MDEKDLQELKQPEAEAPEFSLEEIMREFGGTPEQDEDALQPEEAEQPEEAPAEEQPEEENTVSSDTIALDPVVQGEPELLQEETPVQEEPVSGDTIRLDTLEIEAGLKKVHGAAPIQEEVPCHSTRHRDCSCWH